MRDFLHNHGNKVIAVVGAALALSFILPSTMGGGGGPGGTHLGTLDGQRVTADELREAQNLVHSVDRVIFPDEQRQERTGPLTLGRAIFLKAGMTPGQYEQVRQNPLLVYLLLAEARRAGAAVEDRTFDGVFADPFRILYDANKEPLKMSEASDALKTGVREDARRLAAILAYHDRIGTAFKFSKPLVDEAVARQFQQVKLRVAPFEAKAFADKIAPPTDDELRRQFAGYASKTATVTNDNPFGFGYRVPDRIGVQWLVVPDAEVRKAVDAMKSADDWDIEARVYYRKNPDQFKTAVSTTAPSTQPATRPYADVAADAMKAIKDPEIDRLKRKAAAAVVQQLNVDYQKASRTPSTQQASTAFGPNFGSFEYLQKLADQVQKQTGVRPTAVAPKSLLSQNEFVAESGVGSAILFDSARQFPSAGAVIFGSLRPFQTEPSAMSFEVGQPAPVLTGSDGNDLYVVRVVEADPSHAAKQLADVRADVERDVRRAKAYDAAEEAAKAALAKATNGLDGVGVNVQTGDFYGIDNPTTPGLSDALASGVIGPAFEALKGVTSPAALPVRTIAKLKKDGIAAVVEIVAVRTDVNTANEPQRRMAAMRQLAGEVVTDPAAISSNWFNFDNVARRVGYVAEKTEDAPKNTPKPMNPLMPG